MQEQYKKFKIERLDSISPTFCAAKWLRTDIYLHTGVTSSCNFPKPGPIDLEAIQNNVLAIHNTQEKIDQRNQMLAGLQPALCSNCWNVENADANTLSHRTMLSYLHRDQDFSNLDLCDKIVPEYVCIAFDSLCNFTCSYCDATQSSSWATDLKVNGPYKDIKFDIKRTYQRIGSIDLLTEDQQDYLFEKTMQLIGENIQQIKVINLLGGEPTMSPKFWIFINWLATQDVSHLLLKITTNLSHPKLLEKLLLFKKHFKKIELNISIDGYKQKAEFTRYGLKWSQFEQYVDKLLTTLPDLDVDFIGTVNILSLDGLVENLDWRSSLKQKHSNRLRQACSVVRWPQFQSITILPKHIREHYAQELKQWVEHHKTEFTDDPYLGTTLFAIIKLLEADHNVPNIEGLQKDFKKFVIEFAGRRDLDIKQTFSKILTDWILEDNHGQTI